MSSSDSPSHAYDWRTITALNVVSTLSQIGQFGIVYVMVPVWLALQGLSAAQLGFFAASLWLGQMPGLALAPWLCHRWGARRVVVAGLACSVLALLGIAYVAWPLYLLCGLLAGLGMGLRWVGLEPWLYRIAPAHARGRLVGFHETLIAAAPVVAPAIAALVGVQGYTILWVGIGFTVSLLIGELAFDPGSAREDHVKVGVLIGSLTAATLATVVLRIRNRVYRRIEELESRDDDGDGVPDVFQPDPRTGPHPS